MASMTAIVNNIPFKYESNEVPASYVCGTCGASNCKLWRRYQTFLDNQDLFCVECAGKNQKRDTSDIDAVGEMFSDLGGRSDQIGWLIPAVPTEENDTFWGYTSVPEKGCEWWRRLPSKKS